MIPSDLETARYPPISLPAGAFDVPSGPIGGRDPLAGLEGLPRKGRLEIFCLRPIHHVLEYEALYRLVASLRQWAPALEIHLHLRSALRDDEPFARLPAHRVTRLAGRSGAGDLAADFRRHARGWEEGTAALVLAPPAGWRRVMAGPVHSAPLGFRTPGCDSPECAAAAERFLAALYRETPLWRVAEGAPPPLPQRAAAHHFLIHQARFHIGDALWLTPLLRALHTLFFRPIITLVAPPAAVQVLAGNPYVAEIIPYQPQDGEAGRQTVLAALSAHLIGTALFAFGRRHESRWLVHAMTAAGVPRRINLEYHDAFLDAGRPWDLVTHEGWLFWGTMASPRLLLHALDPLLPSGAARTEDDDLALRVSPTADWRAGEIRAELGIGDRPFAVLAPGGLSSRRWPAARFAKLAAALAGDFGMSVLIEGSPEEAPLLHQVATAAGHPSVHARQDSLPILAALLTRARLLVANDSAPIHFAAALGTPTLYFAQREKLAHSHPRSSACWALYDDLDNDPHRISTEAALGAVRDMVRRGVVRAR